MPRIHLRLEILEHTTQRLASRRRERFVSYVDDAIRHKEFMEGSSIAYLYRGWLLLLKFVVPVGIVLVFLHAVGVI